jgi:hypothetical protein
LDFVDSFLCISWCNHLTFICWPAKMVCDFHWIFSTESLYTGSIPHCNCAHIFMYLEIQFATVLWRVFCLSPRKILFWEIIFMYSLSYFGLKKYVVFPYLPFSGKSFVY